MKTTIAAAFVAASLLSLAACNKQPATDANSAANNAAPGGIDGTWKVDPATVQIDAKPDEMMLKDGKFTCCSRPKPRLEVATDGEFHPVTGSAYVDSASVKVNDDHNVTETMKTGNKVASETKYSVSDDGKTLKVDFKNYTGAKTVKGSFTETRVGAAPSGAHALSGSWKMDRYTDVSDEGNTVTYKLNGDTLHMTSPTGQSYDAKVNGAEVPMQNDIGKTTVSVTKTGDNAYHETDKRDGKVVGTTDFTVDGDVIHAVNHNERDGSTTKYDMKRM